VHHLCEPKEKKIKSGGRARAVVKMSRDHKRKARFDDHCGQWTVHDAVPCRAQLPTGNKNIPIKTRLKPDEVDDGNLRKIVLDGSSHWLWQGSRKQIRDIVTRLLYKHLDQPYPTAYFTLARRCDCSQCVRPTHWQLVKRTSHFVPDWVQTIDTQTLLGKESLM